MENCLQLPLLHQQPLGQPGSAGSPLPPGRPVARSLLNPRRVARYTHSNATHGKAEQLRQRALGRKVISRRLLSQAPRSVDGTAWRDQQATAPKPLARGSCWDSRSMIQSPHCPRAPLSQHGFRLPGSPGQAPPPCRPSGARASPSSLLRRLPRCPGPPPVLCRPALGHPTSSSRIPATPTREATLDLADPRPLVSRRLPARSAAPTMRAGVRKRGTGSAGLPDSGSCRPTRRRTKVARVEARHVPENQDASRQ